MGHQSQFVRNVLRTLQAQVEAEARPRRSSIEPAGAARRTTPVPHTPDSTSPPIWVALAMIRRDNTVLSSSIADLQIEYTGKGTITQGMRPGLVVRLINWIF